MLSLLMSAMPWQEHTVSRHAAAPRGATRTPVQPVAVVHERKRHQHLRRHVSYQPLDTIAGSSAGSTCLHT